MEVSINVELWNPYNATLTVPAATPLALNVTLAHAGAVGEIQNVELGGSSPGTKNTYLYSAKKTLAGGAWPRPLPIPLAGETWRPGEIKHLSLPSFDVLVRDDNGTDGTQVGTFDSASGGGTMERRFSEVDQPQLTVNLGYQGAAFIPISDYTSVQFPTVTSPGVDTRIYYSFQARNFDTESGVGSPWPTYDPRGPSLGTNQLYSHGGGDNVGNAIQGAAGAYLDSTGTLFKLGQQVVLFDVPRQEVLSVASLRHIVYGPGSTIYRIGTHKNYALIPANLALGGLAAGDNANDIFETHFFSSVPRRVANPPIWAPSSGAKLANTAMVIMDPSRNGLTQESDLLLETDAALINDDRTGLSSVNSAQYLLVRDTLNINSTSVAAWRAFLAGALPTLADPASPEPTLAGYTATTGKPDFDFSWLQGNGDPTNTPEDSDMRANWRYFDGSVVTVPVRNVFFRFPHSATNLEPVGPVATYTNLKRDLTDPASTAAAREKAAFRLGMRELRRGQIEELAWWVVYYIKNRPNGSTGPFRSLTEFINEGILQIAIDSVGNPNFAPIRPGTLPFGVGFPSHWPRGSGVPDPINPKNLVGGADLIPLKSPGYLTQGDVLELIGHRLFARSDTFIIRVYGDVNDPDGRGPGLAKITSRVWLEATVQRTPVKHPTSNQPDNYMLGTGTGYGNFGRQFRILSLRWLRPDEV